MDEGRLGSSAVELYWLPLGAGGHSVRYNGRVFESVAARVPYYMALNLLRIARNDYIDRGYAGRLVAQAKKLLLALRDADPGRSSTLALAA